jgi:hypothetical protein
MQHIQVFAKDLLIVHVTLIQGRLDGLESLLTHSEVHCHVSGYVVGGVWVPEVKLQTQVHC